ncbi:MAG TPA: hypothetical protein ENK18_07195 [Deltaproteobacteria bacterium]|nr:hypothetical protein [Deltaproteobacteria bacterium]
MIVRRLILRLSLAAPIVLLHRSLGSWLLGLDPIHELISGQRWPVAVALVGLAGLRLLCWFALVPWIVGGSLADWLSAREAARPEPRRSR